MVEQPKVSVVIPVYNVAEYLPQCLDSIVCQTLKNIEIICIDDGSIDNSPKILREYQKKDQRIRIITQTNQGLAAAREIGMRNVRGTYIYFCDSDDYLAENALEGLVKKADEDMLDVLFFKAKVISNFAFINNQVKEDQIHFLSTDTFSGIHTGIDFLTKKISERKFNAAVWLQLTRIASLRKNNIHFISGFYYEDEPFTIKLCLSVQRVEEIETPYYYRRIRPDSIMTRKMTALHAESYFFDLMEICRFLWHYPAKDNLDSCIRSQLFQYYRLSICIFKELSRDEKTKSDFVTNKLDYYLYKTIIMDPSESFSRDLLFSDDFVNSILNSKSYRIGTTLFPQKKIQKSNELIEISEPKKDNQKNGNDLFNIFLNEMFSSSDTFYMNISSESHINIMTNLEQIRKNYSNNHDLMEPYSDIWLTNFLFEILVNPKENDYIRKLCTEKIFYNKLLNSFPYKAGRILTFLPRMFRNIFS